MRAMSACFHFKASVYRVPLYSSCPCPVRIPQPPTPKFTKKIDNLRKRPHPSCVFLNDEEWSVTEPDWVVAVSTGSWVIVVVSGK